MDTSGRHQTHLREALSRIQHLLERQALLRDLAGKSSGPRHELVQDLVGRQQLSTLKREINQLHPADIAFVLENLPLAERRMLWDLVDARYDGAVLLEASDAVRETLIQHMDAAEMVDAAEHLDTDEIADLVPDLPSDVVPELLRSLNRDAREQVQSALSFPEGSVGALMEFDFVRVREDNSLDVVLRYLRLRGELPAGMDAVMVVDRTGMLRGSLRLDTLLTTDGDKLVSEVMNRELVSFHTNDPADDAAKAFDRYDLIAAPVVNVHDQLVGVLRVQAVLDHISDNSQRDMLSQAGLQEDEDLFAPVWHSARNRWVWLGLNLVTAVIASRVIGQFEHTIAQIVALAALMPIVAAVGGNVGHQTLVLMIRGYALNQITGQNYPRLLAKEALIGLLNGLLWGGVMALVTLLLYGDGRIALIMLSAMTANLTLASVAGVVTPGVLRRFDLDPAYGSGVILTGITDSMGFFIFLGLAATWLGA